MIEVTNKLEEFFTINSKNINSITDGPNDTSVLKMTNGETIIVSESRKDLEEKIKEYQISTMEEAIIQALSRLGVKING